MSNKQYETKEIRDAILKFLHYQHMNNIENTKIDDVHTALTPIPYDKTDRELRYLIGKGLISQKGTAWQPMFFLSITSEGIDKVEGTEVSSTTQNFINNSFNGIQGSAITINSQEVEQNISYKNSNILQTIWSFIRKLFKL